MRQELKFNDPLKRFLYEASAMSQRYGMGNRREKVTSLVHFPIEGLDMKPYVLGPCEESEAIYDLYAVSNHMGGMGGGGDGGMGADSSSKPAPKQSQQPKPKPTKPAQQTTTTPASTDEDDDELPSHDEL